MKLGGKIDKFRADMSKLLVAVDSELQILCVLVILAIADGFL